MLFDESDPAPTLSEPDLYRSVMNKKTLIEIFNSKFSKSQSKGVDRINGFQFATRAQDNLDVASRKCLDGSYRFTPYLEHLKLKGRGKEPRIVGIPCVRDRIILNQLNKYLAYLFPECVPRNIANTYIREITENLKECSTETTYVCGCDIKTFYDSIKRDHLIKELSKRVKTVEALTLIRHAINTPIVPKNIRRSSYREYQSGLGVPQGLAISNILAAIYMRSVDAAMSKLSIKYYRYVDDVLMYGDKDQLIKAEKSLISRLKRRGLDLHDKKSGKSHFASLDKPFSYLGYRFKFPHITVKDGAVERLLQSLVAKFSDYAHNRTRRLEKIKYLNEKRLADIFIIELNERITGAISDRKRYGWVAYFSQISDLSLLYKLDSMVASMFARLPDFNRKPPSSLKKFSRAYYEMKFNPTGGYVKNYDIISTRIEKLRFLVERGRIDPESELTDERIDEIFERYRNYVLSEMHSDEGVLY